ncbi:MAG: hypothetical protein HQK49_13415 [Oligoflexia bacterium]|nr:hypothetical protein [Oligoflexia bacterium]
MKMCHTPNGSNSTLVAVALPKVKWHHHHPITIPSPSGHHRAPIIEGIGKDGKLLTKVPPEAAF